MKEGEESGWFSRERSWRDDAAPPPCPGMVVVVDVAAAAVWVSQQLQTKVGSSRMQKRKGERCFQRKGGELI